MAWHTNLYLQYFVALNHCDANPTSMRNRFHTYSHYVSPTLMYNRCCRYSHYVMVIRSLCDNFPLWHNLSYDTHTCPWILQLLIDNLSTRWNNVPPLLMMHAIHVLWQSLQSTLCTTKSMETMTTPFHNTSHDTITLWWKLCTQCNTHSLYIINIYHAHYQWWTYILCIVSLLSSITSCTYDYIHPFT